MERKGEDAATSGISAADPEDAVLGLYSAVEESARILGVTCARDDVLSLLRVYGESLSQAVVAFRVATGERHAGELDCRFTVPWGVDPYALAVSNGLTVQTDHPVGALLSDIGERCPIDGYGVDFGVAGGFKKIWIVLPRGDLQGIGKLAAIPSMPRSLGENVNFFARHGLGETAGLLGIDYRHRTVNVYFGEQPAECFRPQTVRAMLDEVGQKAPSERMLEIAQQAFGIYVTLSWESPKLERICFAVATSDPTELPVRLGPDIERFVDHVRRSGAGGKFVCAVASLPDSEYYKLQAYYRWRPEVLDIMQLSGGDTEAPV